MAALGIDVEDLRARRRRFACVSIGVSGGLISAERSARPCWTVRCGGNGSFATVAAVD